MYAVVTSGGKQYRVEPGSTLLVERVAGEPGAAITFERVLLFGDGDRVTVGTPTVDGVTVRGTVLGAERGPKLIVFKYRPKARYRRRVGHRQHLTRVRIDAIETPDGKRRSERKRSREEKPTRVDVSDTVQASQEQTTSPESMEPAEAATSGEAPATTEAEPAKPRRRSRTANKTEE